MVKAAKSNDKQAISAPRSSDYGFIFFVIFLTDTLKTLGTYKAIKLILFHLWCLDWWSCIMVFRPFSSVLIYTHCLDSGDSHFSSVQSQTLLLFTRGIIQHMATVCLWCQIAHKEWLHCLLGEMVANWCSPLLVECYQRTQSSYWTGICSSQSKENCSSPAAETSE